MKKYNEKGTVTLEACIVVPIFIILMLLICGLFIMFMGRQVVTHAVIQAAKSMSFDPYYTERMDSNPQKELNELFGDLLSINDNYVSVRKWYSDDSAKLSSVANDRVKAYLKEKGDYSQVNSMLNTFGVVGGAGGLRFSDSKVEDGVLTLKVSYKQKFPLDATGLAAFDRSITVKVRLFTWSELANSIYEVSFDSNGGSSVTNKVTNESNGSLPTPTKDGYIFLGWSTEKNAKVPNVKDVDAAKKLGEESEGNETLYAVWMNGAAKWEDAREKDPTIGKYGSVTDRINTGMNPKALKDVGVNSLTVDIHFHAHRTNPICHNRAKVEILDANGNVVATKTFGEFSKDWVSGGVPASFDIPVDALSSSGELRIRWSTAIGKDSSWDSDGWVIGTTTVNVKAKQ